MYREQQLVVADRGSGDVDGLGHRWLRAAKVESGLLAEGVAPGGRNEHDQQVLARLPERLQPVLVVVMSEVDAQACDAEILAGQLEHYVVQLEADGAVRAGMAFDP